MAKLTKKEKEIMKRQVMEIVEALQKLVEIIGEEVTKYIDKGGR